MQKKVSLFLMVTIIFSIMLLASPVYSVDWEEELNDWSGETLNVIMVRDPWIDAFEEINPKFEELTGANVEITAYGYDATQEQQVAMGTAEADDHDVIVLDTPWVGQFVEAGFVEDLTPYVEEADSDIIAFDDYTPGGQDKVFWDGAMAGLPFGSYYMTLNYRTDLFEEAGLSAPESIEEYIEAAEYFTGNPDYPGVFGTALNYERGAAIGQQWFELIWLFGGQVFESVYPDSENPYEDMTPLINTEEGREVTQFLIDMLDYMPPGAESFAWDERATSFAMGQLSMAPTWAVRTPGFHDPDQSTVVGDVGTTILPAKEGVEPYVPPFGGWMMGINTFIEEEEKDMAWDYIKWFTSQEMHKEFVLEGGPPSRLSVIQDEEVLEQRPEVETIYEQADKVYEDVRPRIPESHEIIDIVGYHVSRAVEGDASVEEAMQEAEDEVAELLIENDYHVDR